MEIYLKKQIPIAACIYLGYIMGGYNGGWSAPSLPILVDPIQSPLPGLTETQASLVATVSFIGILIGPIVSGYFSNVIGRKLCFIFSGILTTVSFVIMLFVINLMMMIIARILVGFGIGSIYAMGFIYLGEIASTNIRGIILSGTTIFCSFGTLLVYCIGPYVSYKVCLSFAIIVSIIFTVGACFIPESPTFQVLKGEDKKASDILTSLGRLSDIQSVLAKQPSASNYFWTELFTVKSNRRALLITVTLGILQHSSGVTSIIFFTTTIFESVGSSIDSNMSTIIIGLALLISSSSTPFFVETYGRRILLLLSTAACFLTLTLLGAYFYVDEVSTSSTENLNWLPLVSLVVFILSYNAGFGSITATLTGEMFEPKLRSVGTSIAVTAGYVFAFIMSTSFSYMMILGGYVAFWIFAASPALAFIFTLIFVPETKGKTLAEIQYILNK